MDEFFVVDRVENNIAVLECPDGKFLNVEVDSLPFKVREGNVLLKKSDGTFTLSNDEEKKRKAQAKGWHQAVGEENCQAGARNFSV